MTALLAAVLALAVPPVAEDAVATNPSQSAHELRSAIRSALAAEARAESREQRLAAVADIVRLYGELKTNDRMVYRDRIRWRAKLRSRLGRVAADIKRELAQTAGADDRSSEEIESSGTAGGQAVADPAEALVELIESSLRPESWASRGGRGVIAAHGGGGAAGGGAGGAGGFGAGMHGGGAALGSARQAEALIDLIQKTIRPETWEINGGRGTIMYWPGS